LAVELAEVDRSETVAILAQWPFLMGALPPHRCHPLLLSALVVLLVTLLLVLPVLLGH